MIVTDAEAKTKRCQESFTGYPASPEGATYAAGSPFGHGYSMGGGFAVTTSPTMCIGSACMAWRIKDAFFPGKTVGQNSDTGEYYYQKGTERAATGYCGKAGRP